MLKYDFSVQTRQGQKIDSIQIAGRDQPDAERRLMQMYRQCTVLACVTKNTEERLWHASSVEDLLTLISKQT